MSSRVFSPDDPRAAAAVSWTQLPATSPALPAAHSADRDVDWRIRVAELERQCQEKVRQARAAALAEGEAAGCAKASAQIQPAIEQLARSAAEIGSLRPRLRRESEADILQLALAIARRVLRRELAVDPEAIHGLILAALEKLESREICRIRVHPSHAAAVTAFLRDRSGQSVEVLGDARCDPGAAIFETGRGNLDASVETQLEEIERGLADCLRRRA